MRIGLGVVVSALAITCCALAPAFAQTGVRQGVGIATHSRMPNRQSATASPSADSTAPAGNNSSPFSAFTNGNRGPTNIQSDSLSLDYKNDQVHFIGHVHATQGQGTLISDTLDVRYGKDFHQVQNMVANGHVRMSQGVQWCTSDHAVLDQAVKHTLVLTGSPICHDANDQIAGTRITVHLDSNKSEVESAKAVIFPQQSKTRDNEASADHVK